MNYPNNKKYQNLNRNKIENTLKNDKSFIQLLFLAGFIQSDNKERLIFNKNKLKQLKFIKHILSTLSSSNQQKEMQQLLQNGFSFKQAINAINMKNQNKMNIKKVNVDLI